MSKLNCPQCGQVDKVQKVSAIFGQGTSYTSYETPSGAVQFNDTTLFASKEHTAISRTSLSQRLVPPTLPDIKRPDHDRYFRTGGKRLYAMGVLFVIGLAVIIAAIINREHIVDKPYPEIYCLGPILCIYIPFLYLQGNSRIKKYGKQAYAAKMAEYSATMNNYEMARNRWDSAFYCGRCDGVFIPESGGITPINMFEEFLNKNRI